MSDNETLVPYLVLGKVIFGVQLAARTEYNFLIITFLKIEFGSVSFIKVLAVFLLTGH